MITGDLIAFGLDIGILFAKFYKLGKVSVMLNETDISIEGMKAYNEAMETKQEDVEEYLNGVQRYWLGQRKITWFEIYLFTILAFGCLIGGLYA